MKISYLKETNEFVLTVTPIEANSLAMLTSLGAMMCDPQDRNEFKACAPAFIKTMNSRPDLLPMLDGMTETLASRHKIVPLSETLRP